MIWYSIGDDDDSVYALPGYDHLGVEDLLFGGMYAELAAEDHHDHHDGWEDDWPLTVNLHREQDGPAVSQHKVNREMEVAFNAGPVELCEDTGDEQ